MRNAKDLAFHLALTIGNGGAKAAFQFLDQHARVDAFRRQNGCDCRCRGTWGEELESHGLNSGAGHRGAGLGVVDQGDAAVGKVTAALRGDEVQCGRQTGNQRYGWSVGGFGFVGVLALLAQVKVVARVERYLHRLPGLVAD